MFDGSKTSQLIDFRLVLLLDHGQQLGLRGLHINVGSGALASGGTAVPSPVGVGGAREGGGPGSSLGNNPGAGAAQVALPPGFDAVMQQLQQIAAPGATTAAATATGAEATAAAAPTTAAATTAEEAAAAATTTTATAAAAAATTAATTAATAATAATVAVASAATIAAATTTRTAAAAAATAGPTSPAIRIPAGGGDSPGAPAAGVGRGRGSAVPRTSPSTPPAGCRQRGAKSQREGDGGPLEVSRRANVLYGAWMLPRAGGHVRRPRGHTAEEGRPCGSRRDAAVAVSLGAHGVRLSITRPAWGVSEACARRSTLRHVHRCVCGGNRLRHGRRPGYVQAYGPRTARESDGRRG